MFESFHRYLSANDMEILPEKLFSRMVRLEKLWVKINFLLYKRILLFLGPFASIKEKKKNSLSALIFKLAEICQWMVLNIFLIECLLTWRNWGLCEQNVVSFISVILTITLFYFTCFKTKLDGLIVWLIVFNVSFQKLEGK